MSRQICISHGCILDEETILEFAAKNLWLLYTVIQQVDPGELNF